MISMLEDRMEEIDHEAKHALSVLFEAEEIKMREEDFIERLRAELDKKDTAVQNIRESLGLTMSRSEEGEMSAPKTIDDFFARLKSAKRKDRAETFESPADRRLRIQMG